MPRHKGKRKRSEKSLRTLEKKTGEPRVSEWRRRLTEAFQEEDTVRLVAEVDGMELRTSTVDNSGTKFPHWRFVRDGFEVLHYWPTAQSYRTKDGAKGKVRDPHMALTLARWLLGEVDREAEAELIRAGVIGR